jgi:hypothetical protein
LTNADEIDKILFNKLKSLGGDLHVDTVAQDSDFKRLQGLRTGASGWRSRVHVVAYGEQALCSYVGSAFEDCGGA